MTGCVITWPPGTAGEHLTDQRASGDWTAGSILGLCVSQRSWEPGQGSFSAWKRQRPGSEDQGRNKNKNNNSYNYKHLLSFSYVSSAYAPHFSSFNPGNSPVKRTSVHSCPVAVEDCVLLPTLHALTCRGSSMPTCGRAQ